MLSKTFTLVALCMLTSAGCGNPCDEANDELAAKAKECGLLEAPGPSQDQECEGRYQKAHQCYLDEGCIEKLECADGRVRSGLPEFNDCLAGCDSKAQ